MMFDIRVNRRGAPSYSALAFASAVLAAGCSYGHYPEPTDDPTPVTDPGTPPTPPLDVPAPLCDPTVRVKADGPALMVRDPAVLSRFSLQRVLKQLIDLSGATQEITPLELLQRMFDTENSAATAVFADNAHCDSAANNEAFPLDGCPRAEGALATSAGLFDPGDPDYFAPVALVNRFDLTPSDVQTCGEYRIIYAKQSGRTDPNDRLFIAFEGALSNPSPDRGMWGCRPVVETWASLEKETDPAVIADRLADFYFSGRRGPKPLVHPDNFGLHSTGSVYGAGRGQVRLSQRMQDPWEMREFHFLNNKIHEPPLVIAGDTPPPVAFAPTRVSNAPAASWFSPANQTPTAKSAQSEFFLQVGSLASADLMRIRMRLAMGAGESALSGPDSADFAGQVKTGDSAAFMSAIGDRIPPFLAAQCPKDDQLTPEHILLRASTQTCAGCHAPENFLPPSMKIGCGLTWPGNPGIAHIDEKGDVSAALTDVYLPRRAEVMATFLQACDKEAIMQNFVPLPAIPK